MKIHSKFKDYYDSAIGYGIDPALHYVRKQCRFFTSDLQHKLPHAQYEHVGRHWHRPEAQSSIGALLIGFCGRIYPCVKASAGLNTPPVYLHNFAALKGWLAEHKTHTRNLKLWREFLAHTPTVGDALFVELGAPVFVVYYDNDYRDYGLIIDTNPMLKEYEFFRVVDPFTAFQEISMYLGNALVKRDEPLQVPDKYRIAQHGFDEWSFRKQKASFG